MISVLPAMAIGALVFVGPADPVAVDPVRPIVKRTSRELLESPDRRVRTTDASVRKVLAAGLERSPTFAALMTALDRTDVIVYIEINRKLPTVIAGRLLIVPAATPQRYLRIEIAPGGSLLDLVATVGHELQHALEVGEAPDVRDAESLEELYARIGLRGIGAHSYDTPAAQKAGRRIRFEVG
ncbi:MAG TPA: hypothetical protein VLD67_08875 [Vicinamibacterales bacterium]|nr:hypothetical protein [Vicinamibacterales bacterium]